MRLSEAPVWGVRNYRSPYRKDFRDFIEDLNVDMNAIAFGFADIGGEWFVYREQPHAAVRGVLECPNRLNDG